jgi:SnoaL-like protein
MQYEQVREMLLRQWTYTGGPNEAKASELYHDDVVLEFPQSDEWFQGKANQQEWRERYPAKLDFEPQEIRGSGDLWIAEGKLSYDGGDTLHYIKIIQFRDGLVERETLYFAEPFPAPDWRKPWVAEGPRPKRHDDLPAHVLGGN